MEDTYNDAKDSARETKQSIKNKYNETNRDLNRNIEHAKQSWQDSLTPHSYVSMLQANDWDGTDLPEHQCAPFCQLNVMCLNVVGRARCADHTANVDVWSKFAALPALFCPACAKLDHYQLSKHHSTNCCFSSYTWLPM